MSTNSYKLKIKKSIYGLIKYLESLVENNERAALAILRRGASQLPKHDLKMIPYIMPVLYRNSDNEEITRREIDCAFLLSGLFALWYSGKENLQKEEDADFGASWGKLYYILYPNATDERGKSLEARFVALINAHYFDISNHLIYAISLFRSNDIPINWYDLAGGIWYWDHPEKFVQERWVMSYYKTIAAFNKKKNESNQ